MLPIRTMLAGWAMASAVATAAPVASVRLTPESIAGWERYLGATELRIAREMGAGDRFLAHDFAADGAAHRRTLIGGAVVVEPLTTVDRTGTPIEVPNAMVHHWRGGVFIPGVRLNDLMARLHDGPPAGRQQEDLLDSRVLSRGRDQMNVYLKLQRTKIVTVVYNTEHDVRFKRQGPTRASSTSTATKIAEIDNPGDAVERELPQGDDSGYMWRWNSYWRYEEVPGGVIAECESVSLSRDVPGVVRALAGPIIRSTASESMERTLLALRERHKR